MRAAFKLKRARRGCIEYRAREDGKEGRQGGEEGALASCYVSSGMYWAEGHLTRSQLDDWH
jgi:hypothetical protein